MNSESSSNSQRIEELERHVRHLEFAILQITHYDPRNRYLAICLNASMDDNPHPHWIEEGQIDWSQTIIELPKASESSKRD